MGRTDSRTGSGANGLPVRDGTVPQEKTKPVLDEQTFSKLLEAAYVVQEHNREMQALDSPVELEQNQVHAEERDPARKVDPETRDSEAFAQPENEVPLAKIVQTQQDIQLRHPRLEDALQLVADRVIEMAHGCGAAVGIVEGNTVCYRAVSGRSTPVVGSALPPNKCLCAACFKSGKAFRCPDVTKESALDSRECKNRGILALIAVPIFHNGNVTGALELYYPAPRKITDQDVHTCQLMAGLVAEALARHEEITWKQSLATERAAMLEALEKLQPNLAALIEQPAAKSAASDPPVKPGPGTNSCRKCGHQFKQEEQFCGQCGTPRASDYEAPNMQSKVASLWQMQELLKKEPAADDAKDVPSGKDSEKKIASSTTDFDHSTFEQSMEEQFPELFAEEDAAAKSIAAAGAVSSKEIAGVEEDLPAEDLDVSGEELKPSEALTVTKAVQWSSAASARAFLEKITPAKHRGALLRLWDTHRGDVYLAIAVVLVLGVILWGVRSDHSVKTPGNSTAANAAHRKPSPESELSFFDRVLVQLGLAEPPPTPEDKGNPTVQVWVDLHTALYYCPGTDLYGKTPQGKFTTQRAAQLDQFEPAYRKTCK